MNVAINTDGAYTTKAGVARYIHGLIKGLNECARPGVNFFEFGWPVENFSFSQPQRALKTLYRENIWAKFLGPRQLREKRADVYHATGFLRIEPPAGIPVVQTVHDLAPFRFPERYRNWELWSGKKSLLRASRADRVICISRFTADEAMELLGVPASKIDVVYNGCDFHAGESASAEEKPAFDVPPEFFLFVGSVDPAKNLALLDEVYRLSERDSRPLPPLLIVGVRTEGVAVLHAHPVQWHFLGRQPDSVLVHLYRRAIALVFPSKYEGFGLPVIESMALGTPVICSPVASLKEVGGEAALFTDMNPAAYLKAMRRILAEPAFRKERIEAGRAWAANFSWDRCARETVEIYRKAMAK